jgi:hypothetical protein
VLLLLIVTYMTYTLYYRKHGLPAAYDYMKTAGHKELYARDVLTLNEAAMAKVSG